LYIYEFIKEILAVAFSRTASGRVEGQVKREQ